MKGRSAVIFDEVGGFFDIPQIKRYTSLSAIRGEEKGRNSVEFKQTWQLVALANELPRFFPENDGAFLSRVFVLPFSSVFYPDDMTYRRRVEEGVSPERLRLAKDKAELIASLLTERAAIIAILAWTWIQMRSRGGRPFESPECSRAKEAYRQANDTAERFFAEYLVRDEFGSVEYGAIKTAWVEFTGDKNPAMREINAALTKRYPFITATRSHGQRLLRGVSLKAEPDSWVTSGDAECNFLPREEKNGKSNIGTENGTMRHPASPDYDLHTVATERLQAVAHDLAHYLDDNNILLADREERLPMYNAMIDELGRREKEASA